METFRKLNVCVEDQISKQQDFLKFDYESQRAKMMNNLQSSYGQTENAAIGSLQGDWEAVKAYNKYLWKRLKKSKAKDKTRVKIIDGQNKIIANQNTRLLYQEEMIKELKSSYSELENKLISLQDDYATVKLSKVILKENAKNEEDHNLAIIKDLISKNMSQMEDLNEKNAIIDMTTEELAIIKSTMVKLEDVLKLSNEKSFDDEANASYSNQLKSSFCELDNKFVSRENDCATINLSNVVLKENEKEAEDHNLAIIIEDSISKNMSQMEDLFEKNAIIDMTTEELAVIKSTMVELEEVLKLSNEKSFDDEAIATALNQRHLKKGVKSLAELFGHLIPTSTFHLKSNRKKRWTSEKMKPLKFLNALEKNLKKGKLDGVIDEKLGKSPEGVSMSWRDAIQQFIDAARSEFIDTSVIDKCNNYEAEFEQLIKARNILESAETNKLRPIPVDVHKCMFHILKQI
jgi:hypothetical protein